MTDLFQSGSEWLMRQFQNYAAQTITYEGGSDIEVVATRSKTVFELQDSQGLYTKIESQDWVIRVADLEGQPARGDTITDSDGNVYEVLSLPGIPLWEYADYNREFYKVHSKLKGAA